MSAQQNAMRKPKKVLVTGGCGFIGSNYLLRHVMSHRDIQFLNLDALTYAANPMNLASLDGEANYRFVQADICDASAVNQIVTDLAPDWIVHFAAESHVDRSIADPDAFLKTNVIGTMHLLQAARAVWKQGDAGLFHHVSTDEVYGSLGPEGVFTEETAYDPSSPYSASKAASDHLVRAFGRTYGMPTVITNCSNNYGPYQFPEKLIPLMILNAAEGQRLPVYGTGANIRDWLYVEDHVDALWLVAERGRTGETYNIGGESEKSNLDVVHAICDLIAEYRHREPADVRSQVEFVADRPGHDLRYAVAIDKIRQELGWRPRMSFEEGLRRTVGWYLAQTEWTESVRSGAYKSWIAKQYGGAHA